MPNLPRDILALICQNDNHETLLQQLSEKIGEGLDVDFCLVLSDKNSLDSFEAGFWCPQMPNFDLNEQFLSNPIIQNLWKEDHLVARAKLEEPLTTSLPLRAILGVRTEFQGKANGLILLGLAQSHEWTEEEASLLMEIRDQIAIAFALVQLQQETSPADPRDKPTTVPQIVQRLYQLMRQQLEQQRQLNERKDKIIDDFSDQARNPLATMKLAIDMLSKPEQKFPKERIQRYWKILKEEWTKLNEMTDYLVTFKKLRYQQLSFNPQTLHLESLILELSTFFRAKWGEDRPKHLTLAESIETNLQPIQTDTQHLKMILQELLTNAANFSQNETTVDLKVFSQQQGEEKSTLGISIINTGLGIHPEEISLIFEPFRRGKEIVERQGVAGTGIGLAVVKGLVGLLGGTIKVVSTPIAESENYLTQFTLTLPKNPLPARDTP